MNLEQQKELILSGKMYNDLTFELVAARENTVFFDQRVQRQLWKAARGKGGHSQKAAEVCGKGRSL